MVRPITEGRCLQLDPSGRLQGKRKNPPLMVLVYLNTLIFNKILIEIVIYSQKWKISAPCHKRKVIKQIKTRKTKLWYETLISTCCLQNMPEAGSLGYKGRLARIKVVIET